MLSHELFKEVVKNTPLIAIDFCITNNEDKVLLGMRNNNPAKGFYFTFGGIILKNETIDNAFSRISKNELDIEILQSECIFNGVHEQMYKENFLNTQDFDTHYIVLSYKFKDCEGKIKPKISKEAGYSDQHQDFIWMSKDELLTNKVVHPYVRSFLHL